MARLRDAGVEAFAKEQHLLPEEVGFHVQDGLFLRRMDDGRVKVSVVHHYPVSGFVQDLKGLDGSVYHEGKLPLVLGSAKQVMFTAVLTPESWASCMAAVCGRGEDGATWQEALAFHTRELHS